MVWCILLLNLCMVAAADWFRVWTIGPMGLEVEGGRITLSSPGTFTQLLLAQ